MPPGKKLNTLNAPYLSLNCFVLCRCTLLQIANRVTNLPTYLPTYLGTRSGFIFLFTTKDNVCEILNPVFKFTFRQSKPTFANACHPRVFLFLFLLRSLPCYDLKGHNRYIFSFPELCMTQASSVT